MKPSYLVAFLLLWGGSFPSGGGADDGDLPDNAVLDNASEPVVDANAEQVISG